MTAVNAWQCAPSLHEGANRVIRAPIVVLMEARMWFHKLERYATAALVVAIVLAFAVPFVLRLLSPLLGG